MTPEMERAIEDFIRERLQIRLELDRYSDCDGRGIEATATLVLVTANDPGSPFTTFSEVEISKGDARLRL